MTSIREVQHLPEEDARELANGRVTVNVVMVVKCKWEKKRKKKEKETRNNCHKQEGKPIPSHPPLRLNQASSPFPQNIKQVCRLFCPSFLMSSSSTSLRHSWCTCISSVQPHNWFNTWGRERTGKKGSGEYFFFVNIRMTQQKKTFKY